ncbi:MAG TPA: flavodoxin reductase [Chitinophagaceae bacterium]|nr:flavodoxin reductase [Chitinophagaceae bacterium]
MEPYNVSILAIGLITHDVLRITLAKPAGYTFTPGQATEISINKPGWDTEKRPFTFTCLPADDHLEFTIKTYPDRKGVTNELLKLKPGEELIIRDPWGAISYKGEGVFIAGGAGITPFIAIFRHLEKENKLNGNQLLFANKMKGDIIIEDELKRMLGKNMVSILSGETREGYLSGYITKDILSKYVQQDNRKFYVCGPPPMMDMVLKQLSDLGITDQAVVMEI